MNEDKSNEQQTSALQRPQGLTHRTLAGFFWSSSGSGAQALLQIVVLSVLARLITPAEFGIVAAALVVVNFTSIFSQLGVGPAIVQRPNLEPRHLRVGFTLTLMLGVMLMGLLWLAAPAISAFFLIESLTPVLRVTSLVFVLQSISVVALSLLQRELRFRLMASTEVLSYAFYGLIGITLALMNYGVWALVGAQLAQATLRSILLLIAQPHPKLPLVEWRAASELLYFGGGFTVARVFNQLAIQGDNLVVGRWLGAEALGIYGRAYQLMAMPATLFGKVLDKVLFPVMAKVQEKPEVLANVYSRGVALIALVILPASAFLFILTPECVTVLLGPQWQEVVVPFRVFAVAMLLRTSYKMSDSLTRAKGAVYRRAWRQFAYAACVVGGAWIGQHWGVSGVALGVLGALIVNFFLMAQLSLHLTALSWQAFARIHAQALPLAAMVIATSWTTATLLRELAAPPVVTLILALVMTMFGVLMLLRLMPDQILGKDGIWILKILLRYLPDRLSRRLLRLQAR